MTAPLNTQMSNSNPVVVSTSNTRGPVGGRAVVVLRITMVWLAIWPHKLFDVAMNIEARILAYTEK